MNTKLDFWQWFDRTAALARDTTIGRIMVRNGYTIAHTGGRCLAWERNISDDYYIWICDLNNGLGESADEDFFVGLYNADGDYVSPDAMPLEQALATARNWEAHPVEHMRLFGYR